MAAVISATNTEVTLPINAIMNQSFLRTAVVLCPYLTGTKPGMLTKGGGSATMKWRRVGEITPSTTPITEQQTNAAFFGGRDAVGVSNTDITATVAKYANTTIFTEEVAAFSVKQQLAEHYDALGRAAGRSLNMLARDTVDDNATVVYAGGVASAGAIVSRITLNSIDNVTNTLSRNNAIPFTAMVSADNAQGTTPVLPSFWGFCHHDVAYDIKNLSGFIPVTAYAGKTNIAEGEFGMIQSAGCGVRFVQSTDATIDANAGGSVTGTGLRSTGGSVIDVYTVAIYGQDALGSVGLGKQYRDKTFTAQGVDSLPDAIEIIDKGFGSGGTSDPLNEIKTVSYKFWFAGAVLNSNWCRVIKCGATSLT